MPNSNHLRLSCRMIFFLRWCCVNHINHVVICTWTSATWYTGDLYPLVSRSSNFPFRNPNSREVPDFVGKSPIFASSSPSFPIPWGASQDDLRKPLLQRCQEPKGASEGCHLLPWRHQGPSRAIKGHPGAIGGSGMVWTFWTSPDDSRASDLVEGRICRAPLFFVAAKNPGSL